MEINTLNHLFIRMCSNGDLREAKKLVENNPIINISAYKEKAFRRSCQFGHLEIVQWLLSVKPDINVSILENEAFRSVCSVVIFMNEQRYYKIAKWLLTLNLDMSVVTKTTHNLFRNACLNGNLEVAQWLKTLNPNFYVIHYDTEGNYRGFWIRTKEEANWAKRKYLLHIASSGQEDNLLYRLPTDVSKIVIGFV